MGDAGPLPQEPIVSADLASVAIEHETTSTREVTVLVTGFGPFKTFVNNPSWLIASSLPAILQAQSQSPKARTAAQPTAPDYVIRLIVHPSPLRVAYATAATMVPQLIKQHNPDYIFHIGMAGGRDHFTLEVCAHRDNYKIKDVDERDGWREGEHTWRKEGIPEYLQVGWDESDVLARWEREINEVETGLGMFDDTPPSTPGPLRAAALRHKKSIVRLSRDAGRYLCEFVLMESLTRRYLEAREGKAEAAGDAEEDSREGKVAFLHVPGGYTADDLTRGVRVAEAAVRSLVGSWESGLRRTDGKQATTGVVDGRWDGVIWKA